MLGVGVEAAGLHAADIAGQAEDAVGILAEHVGLGHHLATVLASSSGSRLAAKQRAMKASIWSRVKRCIGMASFGMSVLPLKTKFSVGRTIDGKPDAGGGVSAYTVMTRRHNHDPESKARSLTDSPLQLRDGKTGRRARLAECGDRQPRRPWRGLAAYKTWDPDRLRAEADVADGALAAGIDLGVLQGIPVSVKDLYGVRGYPTFAGSPRELPPEWRHEGPVIRALRGQLATVTGKTHTVQFAFGALGTNPHWGTPHNPWDAEDPSRAGRLQRGRRGEPVGRLRAHRAGHGHAGSVRMPASMTGTVGVKTSQARWSIEGISPLSPTLDTPGTLDPHRGRCGAGVFRDRSGDGARPETLPGCGGQRGGW